MRNKIANTTKTIKLSFDLTKFLLGKPEIAKKFNSENFVVYTEGDRLLNYTSDGIAYDLIRRGKEIVKATKLSGHYNSWKFENLNF